MMLSKNCQIESKPQSMPKSNNSRVTQLLANASNPWKARSRALSKTNNRLENWVVDNSSKVDDIQQEQAQLGAAVQQCQQIVQEQGQALNQVAQEVASCTSTLTSQGHTLQQVATEVTGIQRGLATQLENYFQKQTATIEALIEKRPRHS